MTSETELREDLATCTRIFAMQGLIGLHGHVSVFDPETKRVLITPGSGSDKANLRAEHMIAAGLDGKPLEGKARPPLEWPIHMALHAARPDALAIAHLHPPYSTLFAVAKREYRPITVHSAIFADGIPIYPEAHLIETPERGQKLLKIIGDKRAAFLRAHGITVIGRNLRELLHATLALENDACKTLQAEALGGVGTLSAEECRIVNQEIKLEVIAQRTWTYFALLEARWDRQPASGRMDLFP
ncbi:MAG TPA: class II aldolase/adducin family protein [Stellaceae bacterium]|jgi:L-fuculose-phosphate aldolase|nr:class II aldolase/adducin family protein [Stellaceae bacterium]